MKTMNANLLRAKLSEYGMTQEDAAKRIGISVSRFNAKLNGTRGAEFTLADVNAMKRLLRLSAEQIDIIFLRKKYLEKVINFSCRFFDQQQSKSRQML